MVKVTRLQIGNAISSWCRKEKVRELMNWLMLGSFVLTLFHFCAKEAFCIMFVYGFYKAISVLAILARNEYRYVMERRRLFLKILDKIDKRVADESKPLW